MTMADTIAVMNAGVIEQLGDPATLYERPSTTFVANFLGQSNLLPGKVSGSDGDDLVIDVQGARLALPKDRSATTTGDVWFGVRPEKLVICDASTAVSGNRISGSVTDASFTGVSTQYLVKLAWGQEITVVQQNDGTPPLRPGGQVTVQWAPGHGFALDAAQDAHAGEEHEAGDAVLAGSSS
jgi:spermidine/putrescine transport system ATP-binding protein